MPSFTRTIESPLSASDSVAALKHFQRTTEWDKTCIKAELKSGDSGCIGAVYDLTVDFLGKNVDVSYEITSLEDNQNGASVVLKGTSDSSQIEDIISTKPNPNGNGCTLIYRTIININFPYNMIDCAIGLMFRKTVSDAMEGLKLFLQKEKTEQDQAK